MVRELLHVLRTYIVSFRYLLKNEVYITTIILKLFILQVFFIFI
jgi:hypothetical protein